MRTAEYNNYKKHILEYMEAEDIKANIEAYKERRDCPTTWKAYKAKIARTIETMERKGEL